MAKGIELGTPVAVTGVVGGESDFEHPYALVGVAPAGEEEKDRDTGKNPIAVRRPAVGLTPKETRFTTIEVIARDGTGTSGRTIPLINTSYARGEGRGTTNFFVQSFTEQDPETATIVPTFSTWMMSAAPDLPTVVSVSGILLDSKNFQWKTEWRENYKRYLRADQCILRRATVYLTYKDRVYIGYILNSSTQDSQDFSNVAVQFSFTMAVRREVDLASISVETISDAQIRTVIQGLVDPVVSTLKGGEGYTQAALDSFEWARSLEMQIPEEGWDGEYSYYDEVGLSTYEDLESTLTIEELETFQGRTDTKGLERYFGGGSNEGSREVRDALQKASDSEEPTTDFK